MKGHFTPHTEETKNRIRLAKLGKPSGKAGKKFPQYAGEKSGSWKGGRPKCSTCKKMINYGSKTCVEHRDVNAAVSIMVAKRKAAGSFISWNKGNKGYMAAEKHYNWQGGITPVNNRIRGSFEYKEWQRTVFERDGYTCQCCSESRKTLLVAHHIKNFSSRPELRFVKSNGVTLCRPCHKLFHKVFGKKNNNLYQAIQFVSIGTNHNFNNSHRVV